VPLGRALVKVSCRVVSMAEWRDILDRAADNLPMNLDQSAQAPFRQQPAGWPASGHGPRGGSFVASRDLLARELDMISGPPAVQRHPQMSHPQARARAVEAPAAAYRASITQSIGQPARALPQPAQPLPQAQALPQPAPGKSSSGRELAALSVSVGIVVLAVYGFFAFLH
jgi:hypothetical protein